MNKLKLVEGNIFETDRQTIVNTVNCVGVMGAGIAKEAKKRFPRMYKDYVDRCKLKSVRPGKPYLWRNSEPDGKWILNFPTKNHWRNPSKMEWVEQGLIDFLSHYKEWGIMNIAFPALGCGHGGLWWLDVKPVMEHLLRQAEIVSEIYRPTLTRAEKAVMHAKKELLSIMGHEIEDIQLVRSIHTGSEKWNDWRRSEELTLRVKGGREHEAAISQVEQAIENKYSVKIRFDFS